MHIDPNQLISHFKAAGKTQFSIDEIVAHIQLNTLNEPIETNGVILDKEQRTCTFNGKNIILTLKEFELLMYLIDNTNRVQTRFRILSNVWGDDVHVSEETIKVHINKLRNKLNPEFIETKKGLGYMWSEKY